MTSGPSPINSSAAGTPLSRMTAGNRQQTAAPQTRAEGNEITDTFETSDREGDGRQPLTQQDELSDQSRIAEAETARFQTGGDRLDLTG